MDLQQMETTPVKLPIHKHPLSFRASFLYDKCHGCHIKSNLYFYYKCNENYCSFSFHKECAEAPSEIVNHIFHPQHPLLLITNEDDDQGDDGRPCDLCGVKLLAPYYSCPNCDFKVDLTCGLNPYPQAIEHPKCHDHPLVFLKKREGEEEDEEEDESVSEVEDESVSEDEDEDEDEGEGEGEGEGDGEGDDEGEGEGEGKGEKCELCKDSIFGKPSYSCLECDDVYYHLGCVHLSTEVNHPLHSSHPLKLIESESLTYDDASEKACHMCEVEDKSMLYHCSICNFTICVLCTKTHQPFVVEHTKTHKHPLTRFSRRIAATCNLCGEDCTTEAYMCLQCGFVVNPLCIGLPRVININRHDHRISFTHHLGLASLKCGVCRRHVSQYYGAYLCSVCPDYAVHSRCAIKYDIWDDRELEGIPEINEDIAPFKVVGDNLISHFSHDNHVLRLHKDNIVIHDDCTRCEACNYHVGFDPIYKCEECCFVLHEKCANLPMKIRLVFSALRFELVVPLDDAIKVVDCGFCGIAFTGFKYLTPAQYEVDLHCSSVSEPFVYDGHPDPLYFKDTGKYRTCQGCHLKFRGVTLGCDDCKFDLCIECATLPKKIMHSNDEHPLTLCWREEANGKYWCDICETELNPRIRFYTCSDECGGTMHVECVLGDFSRLMPERTVDYREKKFEVILNNHNTRPKCSSCHFRCKVPIILKSCDEDNEYICSRSPCLDKFTGMNQESV